MLAIYILVCYSKLKKMKIIADTNIWYELGKNDSLYEKVKSELICPTFVNIHELIKTENIIDKEDFTRNAIRTLFKFKGNVIFEPPLVFLAQLNSNYHYEISPELKNILKFTELFAKGAKINHDKKDEYLKIIEEARIPFTGISDLMNEHKVDIQKRIKNKKEHKKKDSIYITANFINFCVEIATNKKANLKDMNLDKIELLVKTLDIFFKTLETSKMKVQANDLYDYLILSYVQPGDKYWTKEKRWLQLIKDAGCENYLYKKL